MAKTVGEDDRLWRVAEVPRGWFEMSEDGGVTWTDVPPGSLMISEDVKFRLLNPNGGGA